MDRNDSHNASDIPKGYFSKLPDVIADQLALEKILKGQRAPGFTVPDGYFELQKEAMLSTIQGDSRDMLSRKRTASTPIPLYKKTVLWSTGIAAAITATLLLWQPQNSSFNEQLASMDLEMISAHVFEQPLTVEEMSSLLSEEDLEALQENLIQDDDAIVDYLDTRSDYYEILID